MIPVIDIFAGPGGLGEGFSALSIDAERPFDIRLSIEKEEIACQTLLLRKFVRAFVKRPPELDAYIKGELPKQQLFSTYPKQADSAHSRTWHAELGKVSAHSVAARVRTAIGARRDWVLLGGPPCQAYSLVGRARMRSTRPDFEEDERHFLYREYLRIVADHEPAVFVLENVKGLLTSKHGGKRIVSRILDDLAEPAKALKKANKKSRRYRLYALGQNQGTLPWAEDSGLDGEEYLLRAEEYGIPQSRHRIFIIGVRSDVLGRPELLNRRPQVPMAEVLSDLPQIRSIISRGKDSPTAWIESIDSSRGLDWMSAPSSTALGRVAKEARSTLKAIRSGQLGTGGRYVPHAGMPSALGAWYRDSAEGVTLHESRAHMVDDLHRYLFCACFAKVFGRSPHLRDFPTELHPAHANVSEALKGQMFGDRFRVQMPDKPSTTITSHVSKDGHYYIHYDPAQCRSLSVREAARLQTFPDSYFFEGSKTEQYHQIGNAVPPLLARDIASSIYQLMSASQRTTELLVAKG